MKINNIYKYFYITLIGFVLTGFSETVHAQEDINPKSEEVAKESDAKEEVADLKVFINIINFHIDCYSFFL